MSFILFVGAVFAFEPVTESVAGGVIDWTNMRLVAKSVGRPRTGAITSLEALEGDARAQLQPAMTEIARAVRLDRSRKAGELLDGGDAVADRLEGNLRRWEVYEARYLTSGGVELDAALSLTAWLRPARVKMALTPEAPLTGGAVTGVVIDARGLSLQYAVTPEVLDGAGGHLYGVADMTQFASSLRGPVVYVHDPADPTAAKRAGEAPLFVKAVGVQNGTDLVLEAAGASVLLEAAKSATFLREGSVVVVVSP